MGALAFAAWNARQNGVELAAAMPIDYREPLGSPRFDLVLASDLVYERRLSEPVARWIASALKPGGTALVSDPNRSAADAFPELAVRAGLTIDERAVESATPTGMLHRGRIWTLTHAG